MAPFNERKQDEKLISQHYLPIPDLSVFLNLFFNIRPVNQGDLNKGKNIFAPITMEGSIHVIHFIGRKQYISSIRHSQTMMTLLVYIE